MDEISVEGHFHRLYNTCFSQGGNLVIGAGMEGRLSWPVCANGGSWILLKKIQRTLMRVLSHFQFIEGKGFNFTKKLRKIHYSQRMPQNKKMAEGGCGFQLASLCGTILDLFFPLESGTIYVHRKKQN